ncbi:hypothetical protein C8Q78DRAFT_134058 [Trametes maxima]|nr:hypothetical protein C8Q78DRAFT_134058 [Trametes maxima]
MREGAKHAPGTPLALLRAAGRRPPACFRSRGAVRAGNGGWGMEGHGMGRTRSHKSRGRSADPRAPTGRSRPGAYGLRYREFLKLAVGADLWEPAGRRRHAVDAPTKHGIVTSWAAYVASICKHYAADRDSLYPERATRTRSAALAVEWYCGIPRAACCGGLDLRLSIHKQIIGSGKRSVSVMRRRTEMGMAVIDIVRPELTAYQCWKMQSCEHMMRMLCNSSARRGVGAREGGGWKRSPFRRPYAWITTGGSGGVQAWKFQRAEIRGTYKTKQRFQM